MTSKNLDTQHCTFPTTVYFGIKENQNERKDMLMCLL